MGHFMIAGFARFDFDPLVSNRFMDFCIAVFASAINERESTIANGFDATVAIHIAGMLRPFMIRQGR